MDAKEFIKNDEELKNIDIDNITTFLDIFNKEKNNNEENNNEENNIEVDIEKTLKDFNNIILKNKEEQDNKLYRTGLSLQILQGFINEFGLIEGGGMEEKEYSLYKEILNTYDKLEDLLGELMLEIAEGDKELAREYL